MRDGRRVEHTFPISDHARHVALGPQSVHSHTAEDVDHAKTALSDGKEEVCMEKKKKKPVVQLI